MSLKVKRGEVLILAASFVLSSSITSLLAGSKIDYYTHQANLGTALPL